MFLYGGVIHARETVQGLRAKLVYALGESDGVFAGGAFALGKSDGVFGGGAGAEVEDCCCWACHGFGFLVLARSACYLLVSG